MTQCEGQIEITEYLKSKIKCRKVKDLTEWINSHGKSQYRQIGEIIESVCEQEKGSPYLVDRLTNAVSIYVLNQSINGLYGLFERGE